MGNFSKYRFQLFLGYLLFSLTCIDCRSQCITNIDFSTWSQAGYTANGNWALQNGGSQVHQTVNGNPTFYISPFKLICVKITGDFKTANNDDDFMGFVFSFLNPLGQSDNYDGWLFDWKQVAQASGGYTGQRGMALNRMLGTIPSSAYTQTFWGHQNTPEFNVVQNDFGGIGWVKNQNHHFELRLSYTRATIFIDGDSVFDYEACYLPGYFGFYNYSQPDCYYSNFNFEPYIEFDVLTPQICARDTAAFRFVNICQDSSLYDFSSFQSMTWDFGDGNTFVNNNINIHNVNATHRYAQPGTYNVVLSVQDYQGCIGKDTQQVVVKPLPVPDFSAPGACFGASAPFVNQSTISADSISGYLWSFGEPSSGVLDTSSLQSPSHLYATCDTFSVQLVAISNIGCRDTTSKNVIIHALPVAQFTAPVNTCPGKQVLFTEASTIPNTDTIQSWSWNFADGSPLLNQQEVTGGHVYDTAGTYNVSLVATSTFGCKDTITKTLFVRPKPVANFGSSKVCNGTATVFSDSSTTSAGSINAWGWDFADGGTNITQNPSHLYANAGIHNVTLIAQNTFACTDTITKPVQVYFNPVANFTTQDVCLNDSVFFTDSSYVDNSASVSTYLWVFGDGTPTSNIKNPAHFYTTEGTYNVTLLSTTNQNCSNAANKTVHVFDPPTSNFSVADVCLTDSAIFINTSATPSMGSIASVLWNFGDGSLLNNTVSNPHHLYSAVGTYPVTLITRSSNLACADTITDSITVFPMPIADFAADDVCDEQAVNFFDSSTVTNGNTIAAWNWTFGDNGTSTLQNPTRTYTTFGQYSVQLIATTNNGCKDTISKNIVVHPLPVANFSTGNACLGDTTSFTNQSEIPSNTTNDIITAWNWDLGNNTPIVTTTNTSNLYAAMGSYTVELKVITTFGCADSISKTVVVNPNPVVDFIADDTVGCEPLCVNFTDASSVTPGTNTAWSWNLGDGATGSGITTSHCYNNDSVFNPKLFSITLTVTSDSGCVSTLTKNNYITVYPLSVADFSVSPTTTTITDPVININNLPTGADSWSWIFGGSLTDSSSLQIPPAQTYVDTGSYIIRLITNTQYNCPDTAYRTIVIEPDFMFYVPNAFTPNDDGVNDTFIGKGMFINEFEMMIFDRWGNLVYETNDMNKPWDGKVNGGVEPAQKDVYVYSITVKDFRMEKHKYQGTVSILR